MTTITQPGSLGEQKPTEPMTVHTVQGGGGLRLHVREWGGRTDRRSCSSTAFPQATCAGPGNTRASWPRSSGWWPTTCAATACPRHPRAGALHQRQAVGRRRGRHHPQLGLERPVLVGWSYGGYIICDYLRAHGQDRIGAIDFAGGATKLGPAAFGTLIGPGFWTISPTSPPTTCRPTSAACAAWSRPSRPHHCRPTTSRRCCAQP